MVFNSVMLLLMIGAIGVGGYRYFTKENFDFSELDDYEAKSAMDLNDYIMLVSTTIKNMMKQDVRLQNLTKDELERKKKAKARLKSELKSAAYGDYKAKYDVKYLIKDIITSDSDEYQLNEETIENIIHFSNSDLMTHYYKFLTLLMQYRKEYKTKAFAQLVADYDLMTPIIQNGLEMHDITKERIDEVYDDYMENHELVFADKVDILVQRIFEKTYGFGAIDLLLEMDIDEIDAGVSGIPKDGCKIVSNGEIKFSFEAIWVLFKGVNIHISCIGFDSNPDLIRSCKNIYKYNPTSVLNKATGKVVATMENGNRVCVSQPPMSASYAIWVRKFNPEAAKTPESLLQLNGKPIEGAEIFITFMKWMIKGQRNIIVSGEQACGKTTFMKAFTVFFAGLNLRVQELAFEINLQFAYPDFNIASFQETDTVSSQEILNFTKKTNGGVNIIGEIADAQQTNYFIQTKKRGSRQAFASYHGNTAYDVITSMAMDLLNPLCGIFKEKRDAIETVVEAVNIDCHLVNKKGDRYPERITEIIPVDNTVYPFEQKNYSLKDNMFHFMKNMTDRTQFKTENLIEFNSGRFIFKKMPSDRMLSDMCAKFSDDEEKAFLADMERIHKLSAEIETKYANSKAV